MSNNQDRLHTCRIVYASIFDPSLVYTFMDSIVEYDNIIIANDQVFTIEEVSSASEWKKKILYKFLTPAIPVETLWYCRNKDIQKHIPLLCIDKTLKEIKLEYIKGCITCSESVDNEIKCMKNLYMYSSEILNLILYSLTFIPRTYREIIIDDIGKALGIDVHRKNSIQKTLKVLKSLGEIYCSSKKSPSISYKTYSSFDKLYILVPTGVKEYRMKSIISLAKRLCILYSCKHIYILISSAVKKKTPEIIGICKKHCIEKYMECVDLSAHGDNVGNYIESTLDEKHNALIVIVGDYSKKITAEIVRRFKGRNICLLIVPEVVYIPREVKPRKSSKRIVEAFGNFLISYLEQMKSSKDLHSIINVKLLLIDLSTL